MQGISTNSFITRKKMLIGNYATIEFDPNFESAFKGNLLYITSDKTRRTTVWQHNVHSARYDNYKPTEETIKTYPKLVSWEVVILHY